MFKSKSKLKEELLKSYFKVKKGNFYFSSISHFFLKSDKSDAFQVISDRTYQDLDMDEIFMFIDRTISNVGQQFLYFMLRTIPNGTFRTERTESLIKIFNENNNLKEFVVWQLSRLNNHSAYYISSLFLDELLEKPKWFWVIQALSLISISLTLLSFFFPQLLLVLLVVLIINFFFHYSNREKFIHYSGSFLQLLILKQVANEFLQSDCLAVNKDVLQKSINAIDEMGMKMSLFKLEAKFQSDIGQAVEGIFDLIKALYLIEPLVFFNVLSEIDDKKNDIIKLYKFIAEIDVAISISSLRNELPYYCLPVISAKKKQIKCKNLYHPLIIDFVANSIELNKKSVLLTGSNMSGKTTFIRTIGINAILAQSINTCFAEELVIPQSRVFSAIKISDDLMSDKSYYFEEVLAIKQILYESRSGSQNLFLLDEMFKGTNTVERIAAGKSVLDYLSNDNNIVFISTHDLEMVELLKDGFSLYHFTEVVENENILFDYKIKEGHLKSTNAIRILELNKFPAEIIMEAKQLSNMISQTKINI